MVERNFNRLTAVRFHWWYPSDQDPFYVFNPLENSARFHYYDINYVTYVQFDGIIHGSDHGGPNWDTLLVHRMAIPSPLRMRLNGNFDYSRLEAHIVVDVVKEIDTSLTDLRVLCVLTESNVFFDAPNGLDIHNQVMRDMIPDTLGAAADFSLADSLRFEYTFTLNDTLVPFNCEVVAFAQHFPSHEVLQAGKIRIPELNPSNLESDPELPRNAGILYAYPNPFNSAATIVFQLETEVDVRVEIYDLLGRQMATLVDDNLLAGFHRLNWNAESMPSGVYFARLNAGGIIAVAKLTLIR